MNDIELDALIIRLQSASIKEIQNNLLRNIYNSKEVPYIEGYLKYRIEEERNKPVKMYHRRKAIEGKTFKTYEVPVLEKKGWVDSPVKFQESIGDRVEKVSTVLWHFWLRRWPILLPIIVSVIVALFIHFNSKSTSETKQKENHKKTNINHINTK